MHSSSSSSSSSSLWSSPSSSSSSSSSPSSSSSFRAGSSFQSLGLPKELLRAVLNLGYKVPTPVQRKALPAAITGADLVVMARTGSGKTAAFLLPMLSSLLEHSRRNGRCRGLVLSPTRELAIQTMRFCRAMGKYTSLRAALLVGGESMEDQFAALADGPDIIIATPGE